MSALNRCNIDEITMAVTRKLALVQICEIAPHFFYVRPFRHFSELKFLKN
jgi:hypothetical protein